MGFVPVASGIWGALSQLNNVFPSTNQTPEQLQKGPYAQLSIDQRKKLASTYANDPKYKNKASGTPTIAGTAANVQNAPPPGTSTSVLPSSTMNLWSDETPMVSAPGSGGYSSVLSNYTPREPSAEERAHSANVTSLARLLGDQGSGLYNVSNPAYKQALDYYGQILSGDKAHVTQAIAPEAEAIAELTGGEQKGLANSGLRGGALDTARAEAARKGTGAIANLVPQARQNAAAAGSQLALQGMGLANQQQGQAGSLYSSLADRELQDRLGSQGLDLQGQQLKLQEALGMKGLDMQQMGLALQEKLGMRGLDLQRAANLDSNALQRELGLAQINLSQQQVDLLKQQFQQALKEGKGRAAGDFANILIKALPTVLDFGTKIFKPGSSASGDYTTGGASSPSWEDF